MKINAITPIFQKCVLPKNIKKNNTLNNGINTYNTNISSENYRANYISDINFKGSAPAVKRAYIITDQLNDIPLMKTEENGSYIVDFDSQTEIIYGVDAKKYLAKTKKFDYDTQIIFPKDSNGILKTKEGKEIALKEESALMINEGTTAKVSVNSGYPMIIISKRDYNWYERYTNNAKTQVIQDKFDELTYYNSHLYNGEFSLNLLLGEDLTDDKYLKKYGIDKWKKKNRVVQDLYAKRQLLPKKDREKVETIKKLCDKLFSTRVIRLKDDNYVSFRTFYNEETQREFLKQKGFNKKELDIIMPIYSRVRQTKKDTLIAIRDDESLYKPKLIQKMKDNGILYNNKRKTGYLYWKNTYGSPEALEFDLNKKGFTKQEQKQIIDSWKKASKLGFDLSGLKFIDENFAIYSMNDKLNNWTQGSTNWITNSTAMKSSDASSPFVGVSIVRYDKDKIADISTIRKEETLHSHPNCGEKRQSEVYMITSGAAALNIVKNGKSKVQILREGDLAVMDPGVAHCINSVSGKYEHLVVQVPSAFQYGFAFKQSVVPPKDYNERSLKKLAKTKLEEITINK